MDGDDEVFKETETLLEEGQFRVMKDDNRFDNFLLLKQSLKWVIWTYILGENHCP